MRVTKILDLAVMEIKLNIFLNDTQFRHSNGPISLQRVKRISAKIFVTDEKQLKEIRD